MLLCVWFLSFLILSVTAVFQDEQFVNDWQIKALGKLDNQNLLYSDKLVLNSLSDTKSVVGVSNGDIQWRLHFDDLTLGSPQFLFKFNDNYIATLLNINNGESSLKIWDSITGVLVEDVVDFSYHWKVAQKLNDDSIVGVNGLNNVIIQDRDGNTKIIGDVKPFDDIKVSILGKDHFVLIYKLSNSNKAELAFFNGEELSISSLSIDFDSIVELFGRKLIYRSGSNLKLQTIDFNTGSLSSSLNIPTHDKFITLNTDSYFAFESKHNVEVFNIDGSKHFTFPNVYEYTFDYQNGVFIHHQRHATIIDADTGDHLKTFYFGNDPYDSRDLINIGTNGIDEIYTLLSFKNGTFTYHVNDRLGWKNEFAQVANAIVHTVVDLPIDVSLTSEEILYEEGLNVLEAYLLRVTRHLKELKAAYEKFWEFLPIWFKGEYTPLSESSKDRYFGLEKYLVLGTKSGRIVALNTLNGEQVWSYNVEQGDLVHLENINNVKILVFTKSGPRYSLNALTGELIHKDLITTSDRVVSLGNETFSVQNNEGFDVIIGNQESIDSSLYYVKSTSKWLKGFKIFSDKTTEQTWEFNIGANEKIVAFSERDSNQPIASSGYVLGNRDVLYKYLYPNLASFVVLDINTSTIFINIIDTITGEIVHTVYHDEQIHQDEPINIIFGEHWVIYSYWSNLPTPEQKLVVIDLFESLIPNNKPSSKINDKNVSAFDIRKSPDVLTKSFIVPYKINSLSISQTKFGVTTKSIILSLSNSQILVIPKYVLNSRRVENRDLTQDEKSEFMLLPYDPIINIDDQSIISHEREILGNENIVSIPTNLESTSIVCSYGLDVFCTRITPSSQFDKLTSGFDKVKLIGSIVLLITVILILRPLKNSKSLKAAWTYEE